MLLAIHRDEVLLRGGRQESYADRWVATARALGHEVRLVNAMSSDIVQQLRGADAFLWRFTHDPTEARVAKRLIPALRPLLGDRIFPDVKTCWHFDDKLAQKFLFDAAGIPTPRTWIFWQRQEAEAFCRTATYPLVFKLTGGASSENVAILKDSSEAMERIEQMFTRGVLQPNWATGRRWPVAASMRAAAKMALTRRPPAPKDSLAVQELHNNYLYLQEFLPGNDFDTRVTVIGDRAFAYRRFNRPDDFRASGSGNFNLDQDAIDPRFIRLAFQVARRLGAQSLAVDGLKRGDEPVVGEVSYGFVTWMVHECPGHWRIDGDPATGALRFVPGQVWPEDAILEDLLRRVEVRP